MDIAFFTGRPNSPKPQTKVLIKTPKALAEELVDSHDDLDNMTD